MESTILATILISTARSIEDPRPTTTESTTNYSSTTPMPTITFKSNEESEPEYGGITAAGSDKSSSIVDEIEETMTTDFPPFPKPNVCLVGNTIGECIDAQCPKSFECIEGYCCKVTPEIDCKDELKECKRHLCEKEEYREFLEKKCARSCRKCHLLKEKKKSKSKVKEIKEEIKEKSIENSTSYEKSKETPTNTSKKLSSKGRKKNLRCRDSRNDCKEWIQEGFCDSPIYTIEQRKAICGDSCQLC
uniref:ShKT domain-containing protein n=1 Tax=Rhabditophanes sp. KR3021 TaxID=114890 RepID=A0AC35TKA0_9BILA